MNGAIWRFAPAAVLLLFAGAVRMETGGKTAMPRRERLLSSSVSAGRMQGDLSVWRAEAGGSGPDAAGAALCGLVRVPSAPGMARLYVAGKGNARRRLVSLPGAGGDGRRLALEFTGSETRAAPQLPAGMPDFGFGAPAWSAEIAATGTGYAVFDAPDGGAAAADRVAAAYAAAGWTRLPSAPGGLAMFAKEPSSVAASFAMRSPDGSWRVYAIQRAAAGR